MSSLKGKINAPPKDPDEQPVPRSLTELFAFANKDGNVKKKKKNRNISLKGKYYIFSYIKIFKIFVLYVAHIRVGRHNLVLRHSVPHFPLILLKALRVE